MASDQQEPGDPKQRRREYMREYMRERRAQERKARGDRPQLSVVPTSAPAKSTRKSKAAAKPSSEAPPAPVRGAVEDGVKTELEALKFDEARPGVFQTALALARVLDNKGAVTQHPSAGARLAEILDRAAAAKGKGKSKLAAMRESG
ncbi:hypothetical protein QLQ78_gp01 [Gordonia phage Jojo24]|uniref:Uncharacterized protein n=1 Tax=Gordonia phage Jojo24 TaxID=2859476 RepID=A0AAE7SK84_9CAUD|nr:hypothetical protein QLQ78_gp01 [Gordonia phage Jojo24]QXO13098.1 hypothetical protein SEA_JOJO24_1 [Gordonia phage Jojo24]